MKIVMLILAYLCVFTVCKVYAQKEITNCLCLPSDSNLKLNIESRLRDILKRKIKDSANNSNPKMDYKATSTGLHPSLLNNYISYSMNYVSKIEGVYDYENIIQQGVSYKTDLSVFNNVPVGLIINARISNSRYFRDYIDFNIDLKNSSVRSIAENNKYNQNKKLLTNKLSRVKDLYKDKENELQKLRDSISIDPKDDCFNFYIHSKEIIANKDIYLNPILIKQGDDSLELANKFIQFYEKKMVLIESLQKKMDSLSNVIRGNIDDIELMFQLKQPDQKFITDRLIKHSTQIKNFDTSLVIKKPTFIDRFTKLSLGRTIPTSSQLNFQNISVNGINAAYQLKNYFVELHAGWADMGFRDFVFNKGARRTPDFVYSSGAGIGKRTGNFVLFSVFGGNKRNNDNKKGSVTGTTLSAQLSSKHIVVNGEIAQTNTGITSTQLGKKRSWISDKSNKAYSGTIYTDWPKINFNASGYYKYLGINYYGFNSFRVPANNKLWGFQADQSFFKKALNLTVSIKKNDYKNPYVMQVYDGKNIVRTINASYRKSGFPYISAGYMPSFQYVSINDTVYENNYQTLNLYVLYPYNIGTIIASTGFIFNKFMDGTDQSFYFYSNSNNLVLTQMLQFEKHSAGFNASILKNAAYTYTVFDINVATFLGKYLELKGGFKINNITATESLSKLGSYGSIGGNILKVGRISAGFENGYFPDIHHKLYGTTMGTMTFTTYFK